MFPPISDLELSRLCRKSVRIQMLRFRPSDIDLSEPRSVAFDDAVARATSIPSEAFYLVSPELSRNIAQTQTRIAEKENS